MSGAPQGERENLLSLETAVGWLPSIFNLLLFLTAWRLNTFLYFTIIIRHLDTNGINNAAEPRKLESTKTTGSDENTVERETMDDSS